jgi:flagellar hook-associated protein 3 FlgL
LLVARRLLAQLQFDQLELSRIQTQVSTGRRITSPSDDAPAALRGINLQQILERKEQVRLNLQTSASYLVATDSALATVSSQLTGVRAQALAALNATSTDVERQAIVQQIEAVIGQLRNVGNQKFRERFLFAGSSSTKPPFADRNGFIYYAGNNTALRSYSDLDQLFATNVSGDSVFGAISPGVEGSVDFNPILTETTRLVHLRGGEGISKGSIVVSDGFTSRTIDISSAETIGDVVRLLEGNPPDGRKITARITATGLEVDIDDDGGGNLTIKDVGNNTTAAELGILEKIGTGVGPVLGENLDPRLRPGALLTNILGIRATARLVSPSADNDVLFEAVDRGSGLNGLAIQLVDDELLQAAPGLAAGSETVFYSATAVAARASLALSGGGNDLILTAVQPGTAMNNVRIRIDSTADLGDAASGTFDPDSNTLTLHIDDSDETTLGTLVQAIEDTGLFTVSADGSAGEGFDGASLVRSTDAALVTGDTGNSGGEANTLFIHVQPGQTSANQVVEAVNADPLASALVTARIDDKDTSVLSDAGTGAVNVAATALLAGGSGVEFDQNSGLQIRNGGELYVVDLAGARTVEDVLNLLNGSQASVLAEINEQGTGINVRSRLSGADFSIGENGGTTATELGIRTFTTTTRLADLNHGLGVRTGPGDDLVIRRSDGVELNIDLDGAETIADVIDLINNHPLNVFPAIADPSEAVLARLTAFGNGIELTDSNPLGTGTLAVLKVHGSAAATDLGFMPVGQTIATPLPGNPGVITAADVNPLETKGVFNSLMRLRAALEANDVVQITRALDMLDADLTRVNFSRAEVGARQQTLDILQSRLADEEVELRHQFSLEVEVDLVEAITNLTARQAAYEASLRATARTFQLTLLDFI